MNTGAGSLRRMGLLPLVAATFFLVAGGPYGLEEIVLGHGYAGALALLLITPLIWSLPVALLVGELGAALPQTGGPVAWVTRGLGRFWGLQEAWLSTAVGVVNVAIYPVLLVTYLAPILPAMAGDAPGQPGWWAGIALVAAGTLWNALGIHAVGEGSVGLGALLLAPFAAMAALAGWTLGSGGSGVAAAALAAAPPADASAWIAGILLAMWNTMGYDNAATFAGEVEAPSRNYPRAMLLSVFLITVSYVGSVLVASVSGLPSSGWTAGSWVEVGRRLGGPWLAWLTAACGAVSAAGMYLALLLSWSRLPVAMAEEGWLPAPGRAVLLGGALSGLCLGLGLRRLVEINVFLYGAALLLQFGALVALRVREPALARPFRIPGGALSSAALCLPPTALFGVATWMGRDEPGAFGLTALQLSFALAAVGPAWWLLRRLGRRAEAPAG
jgi:amino acid transporter